MNKVILNIGSQFNLDYIIIKKKNLLIKIFYNSNLMCSYLKYSRKIKFV